MITVSETHVAGVRYLKKLPLVLLLPPSVLLLLLQLFFGKTDMGEFGIVVLMLATILAVVLFGPWGLLAWFIVGWPMEWLSGD